jgi:hypothetical protein
LVGPRRRHYEYKAFTNTTFNRWKFFLLIITLSTDQEQVGDFMKGHTLLLAATMFLGLLLGSASADSIALRDGRQVRGKFAGGTQGVIAFSVAGATQYYDVHDILVMTFEDEAETPGPDGQQHTPTVPPVSLLPQAQKIQSKSSPHVTKTSKASPQKQSVRMIMVSSERAN